MDTKIITTHGFAGKVTSVGLGQVISLLITGTSVFSAYLANNNFNLPITQSSLNYVLCSFYLIWWYQKTKGHFVNAWWMYAPVAVVDVMGNFLVVKAFQYTTLTSVVLIDTFTIPTVAVLSFIFLRRRYKLIHLVGMLITISGIAVVVISDAITADEDQVGLRDDRLKGDFLCLLGAMCYGISNVGQEYLVTGKGLNANIEFLGFLGTFGTITSAILVLAVERADIPNNTWDGSNIGYLIGYLACLFAMYSLTSIFLRISEALLFNISLTTSDFWGALMGQLLFDEGSRPWYWLAVALNMTGIIIYSLKAPYDAPKKSKGAFTTDDRIDASPVRLSDAHAVALSPHGYVNADTAAKNSVNVVSKA